MKSAGPLEKHEHWRFAALMIAVQLLDVAVTDKLCSSGELNTAGVALVQTFQQQGIETVQAAPHALNAASDTQNAQGILAVIPFHEVALPTQPKLILLLDEIRDPGNLGTILRTALAAGVDGVLIPPGTVDPFSPKVMRAGMGAHFKLPIIAMDWQAIQNWSTAHQLQFYLADSNGGQSIYQSKFKKPCGIIIGGEAAGAGAQARQLAHQAITIPMPGPAESLNAGVAAAIILFEFVRQNIEK